ncbi:MAG: cytidine deaminase [Balneolaceae bacterium]
MSQNNLSLKCYSPYSGTEEVCLVEGKSGLFYPGVRIENISFPLTISAVQAAICSCLGNSDKPVALYQPEPSSELKQHWVDEFNLKTKASLPEKANLYNPLMNLNINIHETLLDLCSNAQTIHSGFPVSALLETDDGYIPGVNVETNAWGLGLCAERVALSRAVSAGYTLYLGLHIHAPKGEFSSPCGACRQVLAEWMPDKRISLYHGDGTRSSHFTSHLLPYGFTTSSLNK